MATTMIEYQENLDKETQGHTLFHDREGKHGSYIKIKARDRAAT
jgi:hypothetical protein